jgi:hypothetical protein
MAEGSLRPKYEWQEFGSATVRMSRTLELPTANQCIFIQGISVPKKTPRMAILKKVLYSFGLAGMREMRKIVGHYDRAVPPNSEEGVAGAAPARSEAEVGEEECNDVVSFLVVQYSTLTRFCRLTTLTCSVE